MKSSQKIVFTLIVFICCSLVSSEAGVLLSDSAPTTDVIWTNYTPAGSGNFASPQYTSSVYDGGIAFSLSTALEMNAVTFYIGTLGTGASNADFHISIIEFTKIPSLTSNTSETNPATPTFTYITKYSEAMTMPSGLAADKYITFALSDTVSLDAGKTYGVLLAFDEYFSQRTLGLRNVASTQYLSTVASFRTGLVSGDTIYLVQANEAYFAIQGIPEPSTIFFIGLSSLFAIGLLRRRRSKC